MRVSTQDPVIDVDEIPVRSPSEQSSTEPTLLIDIKQDIILILDLRTPPKKGTMCNLWV